MAFQQPQRPRVARPPSFSYPAPPQPVEPQAVSSPQQRKRPLDESEEWVLFSPSVAGSTTRTHTTSSERTPRTRGISRFSDFGSLDTAARSDQYEEDEEEEEEDEEDDITCQGTEDGETEELDSLDDGLHAFHEPSEHSHRLDESSQTVFPTHDGLGTFPASSAAVQEQLWQFERYNASSRRTRHQRRRSSVQRRLDALEEQEQTSEQNERIQRIERWRLEQSRALLEEIERETRRRRRMSRASIAKSTTAGSVIGESRAAVGVEAGSSAATDAAESSDVGPAESTENESFWQRFTRRVIRDLMGIDENLLSVIFGESLPAETTEESSPSTSPNGPVLAVQPETSDTDVALRPGDTWEHRLLERIARELGILVHQLSEHPGAFSTYIRTQEPPPYAGISSSTTTLPVHQTRASTDTSASTAAFSPSTLPSTSYSEAALWGIEEEPEPTPIEDAAAQQAQREREYWERDLDVRMVFTFLKDRFSSRPPSPTNDTRTTLSSSPSASAPALHSSRAALIRQHHPLVGRNLSATSAQARRGGGGNAAALNASTHTHTTTTLTTVNVTRKDRAQQHGNANANGGSGSRAAAARLSNRNGGGSSCASQSTRKSKRSGSSRNYWDLGGSVGSGPAAEVGFGI